jgi:hypothetical protein
MSFVFAAEIRTSYRELLESSDSVDVSVSELRRDETMSCDFVERLIVSVMLASELPVKISLRSSDDDSSVLRRY